MARRYDNRKRAEAAEETRERIVTATEELLSSVPPGGVTLEAIAERADVAVQTVLRRLGSRDGCLLAVADRVRSRVAAQRGHTAPGDVQAAIDELVAHYEAEGRLVLHLLAHEGGDDPFAASAAAEGRAFHRAWVEACFGPLLRAPSEEAVDALVAATDLYVWKLLRLDLGRSRAATTSTLVRLVRAVLEAS